jgi:hypothetical protein
LHCTLISNQLIGHPSKKSITTAQKNTLKPFKISENANFANQALKSLPILG